MQIIDSILCYSLLAMTAIGYMGLLMIVSAIAILVVLNTGLWLGRSATRLLLPSRVNQHIRS